MYSFIFVCVREVWNLKGEGEALYERGWIDKALYCGLKTRRGYILEGVSRHLWLLVTLFQSPVTYE